MLGFEHATSLFEQIGLVAVLVTGAGALIYAWFLARRVLREDPGTPRMQEVGHEMSVEDIQRAVKEYAAVALRFKEA